MIRRTAQYGSLAVKLAYEGLVYWARTPFMTESDRLHSFEQMEEQIGRSIVSSLQDLRGPAAKLGQMLALESGLLPERYREPLAKLQNAVTPVSYAVVRKVIQLEFGRAVEDVFCEFDPEPLATGSLGQVHRAKLASGEMVAVKLRFPGIADSIAADFALARVAFAPLMNNALIVRTLNEMRERVHDEMDYVRERSIQTHFRDRINIDGLVIPSVYTQYCTERILTTEYMDGSALSRIPQEDKNRAGQHLFDFFKACVFDHGIIHGDSHPGNFVWIPNTSSLAVLDFGAARTEFAPTILEVFRAFFAPPDRERLLSLYAELGADLADLSATERNLFYSQIIEPYVLRVNAFALPQTYRFTPCDTLARDLRMQLLAHAFHPRLQNFSAEFTLLHRTFYGILNLLTDLQATINHY